jgi:hypothetical protein
MDSATNKFVKYFNDFYWPSGIYPCKKHKKDITWQEIKKGYDAVLKKNPKHEFHGDSMDRELIRDAMINLKILDPDYTQKESVRMNFNKRVVLENRLRSMIRQILRQIIKNKK